MLSLDNHALWLDEDDHQDSTMLQRLTHQARAISFGLLYVMLKETKRSRKLIYLGALIECFQLMNFCLHSQLETTNELLTSVPGGEALGWATSVVTAPYWMAKVTSFTLVYWMAVLAVVLAVVDALYVGWAHSMDTFHAIWPVRLLRFGVSVFVSVGYIPVLTILLSGWTRDDLFLTYKVIGGGFAVLMFIPLSLSFSLVFYDPDPTSTSLGARPHSRLQFLTLVVKTILVFTSTGLEFFAGYPESSVYGILQWALMSTLVICSLVLTLATVFLLPFYQPIMNYLRAFLFSSWSWVTVYVAMVALRWAGQSPWTLWLGIGLSAVINTGATAAWWAWWRHFRPSMDADARRFSPPPLKFPTYFHVEIAARAFLSNANNPTEPGNDLLLVIDSIYKQGLAKFPKSGFLHSMYVVHLHWYRSGAKAVTTAIQRAQSMGQFFDGSFLLFRLEQDRSRLATTAKDSGTGSSMDFLAQLEFRRSMELVYKSHRATLKMLRGFWKLMLSAEVDFGILQERSARVQHAIAKSERTLTGLMKKFPSSPSVFRAYAAYLSQIRNDPGRAEDFFNKASVMETEQARTRKATGNKEQSNGMLDENSAFVAVNTSGLMSFVSVQAARIFGYPKREMVGRDVGFMMPSHFADRHTSAVERYVRQGTSVERPAFHSMAGESSAGDELVGKHADGSLFLFRMSMTSVLMAGDEVFVGTLSVDQENSGIRAKQLFIHSGSLKLLGATKAAGSWLGLENNELSDMPVSVLIPNFEEVACEATMRAESGEGAQSGDQAEEPVTPKSQDKGVLSRLARRASLSMSSSSPDMLAPPTPTGTLRRRPSIMDSTMTGGSTMNLAELINPKELNSPKVSQDVARWLNKGEKAEMSIMSREFGQLKVEVIPRALKGGSVYALSLGQVLDERVRAPVISRLGRGNSTITTLASARGMPTLAEEGSMDGSGLGLDVSSQGSTSSDGSGAILVADFEADDDEEYEEAENSHGAGASGSHFSEGASSGRSMSFTASTYTAQTGGALGRTRDSRGRWARLQRKLVQDSTRQSEGIKLLHTVVLAVTTMFVLLAPVTYVNLNNMVSNTSNSVEPLLLAESRLDTVMYIARGGRLLQMVKAGVYSASDTAYPSESSLAISLLESTDELSGTQLALVDANVGGIGLGATGVNVSAAELVPLPDGAYYEANGTELVYADIDIWDAVTNYASSNRRLVAETDDSRLNTTVAADNNPDFQYLIVNGPNGLLDGTAESLAALTGFVAGQLDVMNMFSEIMAAFVVCTAIGMIWCSIRPVVYLVTQEKRSSMAIFTALDLTTIQELSAKRQNLMGSGDADFSDEDVSSDDEDADVMDDSRGLHDMDIMSNGRNGNRLGGRGRGRRVTNVDASTSSVHKRYVFAGIALAVAYLLFNGVILSFVEHDHSVEVSQAAHRSAMIHAVDFALVDLVSDPSSVEKRAQFQVFLDEFQEFHEQLGGFSENQELGFGDVCAVLGDCSDHEQTEADLAEGGQGLTLRYIAVGNSLVGGPDENLVPDNELVEWMSTQANGLLYRVHERVKSDVAETWTDEMSATETQLGGIATMVGLLAVVVYFAVYRPMVRFLISEMSSIGFMISLVPVSAIERNRVIKRFLLRANRASRESSVTNASGDDGYRQFTEKLAESFKARIAKAYVHDERGDDAMHVEAGVAGGKGLSGEKSEFQPVLPLPAAVAPGLAVTKQSSLTVENAETQSVRSMRDESGLKSSVTTSNATSHSDLGSPAGSFRDPVSVSIPVPDVPREKSVSIWSRLAQIPEMFLWAMRMVSSRGTGVSHPRGAAVCIIGVQWSALILIMWMSGAWSVLQDYSSVTAWVLPSAMVSGATPFGIGSLLNGYLEDVINIPAGDLLPFAWGTGGMITGSAGLWAWIVGAPLELTVIKYTVAGSILSSTVTLFAGVAATESLTIAMSATWMGFVVATPLVRKKAGSKTDVFKLIDSDSYLHAELVMIGLLGGLASALLGHSLDTLVFAMCTMFYRLDVRVAAITATVCAGLNGLFCFAASWFVTNGAFVSTSGAQLLVAVGFAAPVGGIIGLAWMKQASEGTAFLVTIVAQAVSTLFALALSSTRQAGSAEYEMRSNAAQIAFIIGIAAMSVVFYLIGVGGLVRRTVVSRRSKDR